MNHVAVERCHQCGASFPVVEESTVIEASAKKDAAPAPDPALADRAAPAPDSIPVALSTRIDADGEPAGAPSPGTASSAASLEHDATPRAQPLADHESIAIPAADARSRAWRAPRRSGAPYVALAAVAVCVIAGAAYYAYDARLLPAVPDLPGALSTKDAASSAAPSGVPATAAPATADRATPTLPEAPSDATIAPAVTPRAAPPPGPAMAPAPKPQSATAAPAQSQSQSTQTRAATPSPATNQPPLATTPAASAQRSPAPPARSTVTEEARSASRTARPATEQANSRSQADRDALATQRLIERDLKGFLPPERPQDRGSRSQ